jgi:chromosome segregation ATPase
MKIYFSTMMFCIVAGLFLSTAATVSMAQEAALGPLEYDRIIQLLLEEQAVLQERLCSVTSDNQHLWQLCFEQEADLGVWKGYCRELRRIIHYERSLKIKQTQQISEFYQERERKARFNRFAPQRVQAVPKRLWADIQQELDFVTSTVKEVVSLNEQYLDGLDRYERAVYALQRQLREKSHENASLKRQLRDLNRQRQQDRAGIRYRRTDGKPLHQQDKAVMVRQKDKIEQLNATIMEYRRLVEWQSQLIRKQDQHILVLEGRVAGLSAWKHGF